MIKLTTAGIGEELCEEGSTGTRLEEFGVKGNGEGAFEATEYECKAV